jgi:hypothetical protein
MVVLHFAGSAPYSRNISEVQEKEIDGKFDGWQKKADYNVRQTVILQVDTTNVSPAEYGIAPNIAFLSDNSAI